MKDKNRIIISIVIMFLIISGSYLLENIMQKNGLALAKIVKITEKGKVITYISPDTMKQLVQNGADEDNVSVGPSLGSTLQADGVSEFSKVEVKGAGQKECIDLNKKDVTDDLVIELASDGTMNLCRKSDSSILLIKGIIEISITY